MLLVDSSMIKRMEEDQRSKHSLLMALSPSHLCRCFRLANQISSPHEMTATRLRLRTPLPSAPSARRPVVMPSRRSSVQKLRSRCPSGTSPSRSQASRRTRSAWTRSRRLTCSKDNRGPHPDGRRPRYPAGHVLKHIRERRHLQQQRVSTR